MIRNLSILFMICFFVFAQVNVQAQSASPGSIESSWNNAPKKHVEEPTHYPKKVEHPAKGTDAYQAWEKMRSPVSQPWPYLSKSPTPINYYNANSLIIDSLQSLYCLSTNYIRTLRSRNEGAYKSMQPPPPLPKKDFQYKDSKVPYYKNDAGNRESLSAFYKELQNLLQNCLYGR